MAQHTAATPPVPALAGDRGSKWGWALSPELYEVFAAAAAGLLSFIPARGPRAAAANALTEEDRWARLRLAAGRWAAGRAVRPGKIVRVRAMVLRPEFNGWTGTVTAQVAPLSAARMPALRGS